MNFFTQYIFKQHFPESSKALLNKAPNDRWMESGRSWTKALAQRMAAPEVAYSPLDNSRILIARTPPFTVELKSDYRESTAVILKICDK